MIARKVLSSYTFRFMWTYVASLSVASLIVMVLVYAVVSYGYFKNLQEAVANEANTLLQIYEEGGADAVDRYTERKLYTADLQRFFYLVVDENKNTVVGNLNTWPKYKHYGEGWLGFQLDVLRWDGQEIDVSFIAKVQQASNGHLVMAARHQADMISHARVVAVALVASAIVTTLLGAFSGAIVAGVGVKNINKINRSLQRIMNGDLSERLSSRDQHGEMGGLVTGINRVLDRIQMLMESMRQVSNNIAHDLRTPLTRMRNHLTQLQERVSDEHAEDVELLIEEADGLLATFNALLRIAQVEAGSRREAFTHLDPQVVLADVVELYEPLAAEKSISMDYSPREGTQIDGDRDLLFQAFANLIDNAIKYAPEQGLISILMEARHDTLLIRISDNGPGIPKEDREKVFRRFFRVEASRSQHPGNGLGLSLVYAVIKIHAGNILLSDNRPGLCVDVTLPLVKPSDSKD